MLGQQEKKYLSPQELLAIVEQLSLPELDRFVSQVLGLQAQRRAANLPQPEADLLTKINHLIPADLKQRYDTLVAQQQTGSLAPDEQEELRRLTDHLKQLVTRRAAYVAELENVEDMRLLRERLANLPTKRLSETPGILRWEDVVEDLTDG